MIWIDVFIGVSLLFMAIVDIKSRYIYDVHIIVTGFLICLRLLGMAILPHIYGAALGFLFGYVMYKGAFWYYKEEAFGFGDVLLLMILGLYFGWPLFLHYFVVCYMLIGLVILVPIVVQPKLLKVSVPMAPFYIFGGFAYKLMGSPDCLVFVVRLLEYLSYLSAIFLKAI